MKSKDILYLVSIAVVVAIVSWVIAGKVFNNPKQRSTTVPVVEKLPSDFPDVLHDSNYSTFLNDKALDPTQPVKIGTSNNKKPF